EVEHVDPFIFLDDGLIEGELPESFAKHPHTGLTAVTYLLEGTAHAWDNQHGNTPDLNRAGGVYCINSGRGVVHGEAPIAGVRKLRTLQLWFNPNIYKDLLPQAHYQLFQPDELPVYQDEKMWAKVIIGKGFNLTSPVQTSWPIQYQHFKLAPGKEHQLEINDKDWQGFIYTVKGKGHFGTNNVLAKAQDLLILGAEPSITLSVKNECEDTLEFVIAAGQPHHKPFVKLLGHGGALIAASEEQARASMKQYEADPEHFGQ
ncbi:MAG: hypothetical protein EPN84_05105, partial [Legionella sp.]